ncbi:MAG TPA: inositol monophosphatase family protein [Chloroflexota bacterium]|jgi:myo-inositol-1(or 4)-monophosphatase|nr:inositol monophosphatase family protein [Chloroflexota bacterium]
MSIAHARRVAIDAATASGKLLRERMDSIREVRHKGAFDLVTDVDVQSEQQIRSTLRAAFPTHTVVGEEGGARLGSDPRFQWFVDPLDGTTNYAHGFPFFCVSIGLEVEGVLTLGVVYSPCLDELFVAEAGQGCTLNGEPTHVSAVDSLQHALLATGFPYDRSLFPRSMRSFEAMSMRSQAVRRAGSAALDLCYVACGRLDGYWEHTVKPWDLAAGVLMVREAGGRVSVLDGGRFNLDAGQVLSSNAIIHGPMSDVLTVA